MTRRLWIWCSAVAGLGSIFFALTACGAGNGSDRTAEAGRIISYDDVVKKGCIECHGLDEQRLAPSFEDIALRYQGSQVETRDVLAVKVVRGGAGNWGFVPMPSHPHIAMDEAQKMVEWILNNKYPTAEASTKK